MNPEKPTRSLARFAVLLGFCGVFLYLFKPILAPFLISAAFAYSLHPLIKYLEGKRIRRSVAALSVVCVLIFILILLTIYIGPLVIREGKQLVHLLPGIVSGSLVKIQQSIISVFPSETMAPYQSFQAPEIQAKILETLRTHLAEIFTVGSDLLGRALSGTAVAFGVLSSFLLLPLLIFYFLRDWPQMLSFVQALFNQEAPGSLRGIGRKLITVIHYYFRGILSVSLILSGYYVLSLNVLGVKFALVLGLLSGFATLLPYVGFFLSLLTALFIYYPSVGSFIDLWPIVAIYGFAQVFEGFFLTPKLVGDKVGLHPLWVIFSLLAGSVLFGFVGLLFAVPIAGCIGVVVRALMHDYHLALKGKPPPHKLREPVVSPENVV